MPSYRVTWVIDVEAANPEAAAREARACQGPDTTALVFEVQDPETGQLVTVDLTPLNWYQVRLPIPVEHVSFEHFKPNPGAPYPTGVTCRYLVHDTPVHCCSIESFWEAEQMDHAFTWDGVDVTDEHREAWDEQDYQLNDDLTTDYLGRGGKATPQDTWPHAYAMGCFEPDDQDVSGRPGYYRAREQAQGNHHV